MATLLLLAACGGPALPAHEPTIVPSQIWQGDVEFPLAVIDGSLWIWLDEAVRELDVRSGRARRTWPVDAGLHQPPASWEAVPGGFVADHMLLEERDGRLVLAWQGTPGPHLVLGDHGLFCDGQGVAMVDLLHRQLLWRATLPEAPVAMSGVGGLHVRTAGHVVALEPDGSPRWTLALPPGTGAVAARDDVVLAQVGPRLVWLDGPAGFERSGASTGGTVTLLATARWFVAAGDGQVAGYDDSGIQAWHTALPLAEQPALTLADELILVVLAGGQVAALDRDDGQERWRTGLGMAPVRLLGDASGVVAVGRGRQVAGVALPLVLPEEQASVEGRVGQVFCDPGDSLRVLVNDREVLVDGQGHYQAQVVARGVVLVRVAGAEGPSDGKHPAVNEVTVHLDGHGRYRLPELRPSFCPGL